MPEEKQDPSKAENKFKLTLLQMQNRFVDLETALNELSTKVGEGEQTAIAEVNQRVDDIEDLIMVEQAGIIELKKMLEEMPKPQAQPVDLSNIEKKLVDLEQKVATPAGGAVDLQPLTAEINALKQQVDEKIKELSSKVPSLGEEFASSKYEALQKGLTELINKKAELDLKIEGLKKSVEIVEHKIGEMSTEKFAEEIQNNKKDIILTNAKMETVERVVKSLNSDLQQAQATLGKFESFDKLTLLGKEIESKIERFKLIEDELRRLSGRMEALYSNMDKRLDEATKADKKIPELLNSITGIRQELDKQKLDVLDRVKKEDIKTLTRNVEQEAAKVTAEMEKRTRDVMQRVSQADVVKKADLENLRGSLYREMKNKLDVTQLKDFVRKGDLQNIYKYIKELDGKYVNTDKKLRQVKIDEILKVIEVVKKDMEEKVNSITKDENSVVNDIVKRTEMGLDDMDYRIQNLLDKIVYLESRMAAIEKMMENMRMQPLILE